MSKLGCRCGHVIYDQTDSLPYKGYMLTDSDDTLFFDWLVEEAQSYVAAAQQGAIDQWLIDRGYSPDYRALKLNHGHILHDHIHQRYCTLRRDLYECEACGRVHVETTSNQFASYAPDNGMVNAVMVEKEAGKSHRPP